MKRYLLMGVFVGFGFTTLALDPNLQDAYVLLSSAYKKKGREREAAAALEEAKRLKDPK